LPVSLCSSSTTNQIKSKWLPENSAKPNFIRWSIDSAVIMLLASLRVTQSKRLQWVDWANYR
jgi:hypothetical protein